MKNFLVILILLVSYSESWAQNRTKFDGNSVIVPIITNRAPAEQPDSACRTQNRVDAHNGLRAIIYASDSLFSGCVTLKKLEALDALLKKEGNWLVFVHGDSKTLEEAALRGAKISNLYDINVLVYAWPSKGDETASLQNFKNSKRNAEAGIEHFADFMAHLQKLKNTGMWQDSTQKLSLFVHSLGNYYLEHTLRNNLLDSIHGDLFDNVILNAAAAESSGHGEWVSRLQFQKRIYITGNRHDFNLQGVHFFTFGGNQLGQRFIPPLADNASYIDFSKTVNLKYYPWSTHSYFFGRATEEIPPVKDFYRRLFHGEAIDFSTHKHISATKNPQVFWFTVK